MMPLTPLRPGAPVPITQEGRVAARLAAIERRMRQIASQSSGGSSQNPAPLVDVLPAAGRLGRQVILSTTGKLYRDNGVAWVAIG
jgi:antitoxin (DNA-binding transcriptional repressor) of toxin-antitoxin stability system